MPSVVSNLYSSELGVEVTTGLYGDPRVLKSVLSLDLTLF